MFLATIGNIRHNIVQNIERGHTRVACTGDRLERGGVQHCQTKSIVQGFECQDDADARAVGVGNQTAPPAALGALPLDDAQVIGVDFGNEQRHIRRHAVGRSISANGNFFGPQWLTDSRRFGG